MKKSNLRATAAWQALALLGAGVPAALLVATPAAAQDYTRGSVSGKVSDAQGGPLGGASIVLTSNEQGFTRTATTDAAGNFSFNLLPTGSYTLVVKDSTGATIVSDPAVSVTAGGTANYSYTAGVAAAPGAAATEGEGQEVVVTGTRVQTNDFGQTTTGLTIDVAKLVENVPVPRTQSGLILLAPGTNAGDTGFGDCTDCVSFGGATIAENSYFVNGLNTTNFRTFVGNNLVPFEFYRTFDVKTGGWSAEYGRALGGVTSAVTKSGSNRFEAGAVFTYAPNAFQSDSPNTFTNTAGVLKQKNDDDYRESFTANLYAQGPIIKDRLFFYGLFTPRFQKSEDTSVSGGFRFRSRSSTPFYGLKLDAIPIDGHRLEGTFWSDKRTIKTDYLPVDQQGNVVGDNAGREVNKIGGNNFIGQYTGQFTDFFTLSLLHGVNNYRRSDVVGGVARPIVQSTLNGGSLQTTTASGIPLAPTDGKDRRKVYRADADVYVNFLGQHHFRAGYDREDLTSEENTFYTGDRIYRFTPNYIRARTYFNLGKFESTQTAFYIQDSWDLFNERLNLQLGLRNDSYENAGVSGDNYLEIKNQWAPRLGASFDVFGDKLTKINAFFGRYYLGVPTNTNIRLAGAETFYEQRFNYLAGVNRLTPDASGIPAGQQFDASGAPLLGPVLASSVNPCPAIGPGAGSFCSTVFSDGIAGATDTLVAENLKPMFQNEFIIGATHKMEDWTFGLRFIHRRLKETLEDVAIDAAVLAYCDANGVVGCDSTFTGFHQYVLANPGSDITVRLDGDCATDARQCGVVTLSAADLGYPKPKRKYNAVEFLLDKSFNGTYGFNASYTYQKVRGNYEGSVKSDNNQDDAGLTQDFDQPGLTDGSNGILANERKHTFKVYGSYKPIESVTLGANLTVQSPRNFSCIGVHPTDAFAQGYGAASFFCANPLGNGGSTDSVQVNRGTAFKGKWLKNLDLGAQYNLPRQFGRSSVRVDVFNLLNSKSKTDYVEFGENDDGSLRPDYKLVTGYQAPRSIRLTLAMRFGAR